MNSTDDTSILTRTDTTESIENIVNSDNRTLGIILAVTLPTLTCIILLTLIIICYRRRRHTSIWVKKLESSSRLQAIVINLSSPSTQAKYSEKQLYLSPSPSFQTHTETIIYNRLVGETNRAFETYSTNYKQHTTTRIEEDVPVSLQVPVRIINSAFVEAIAIHRLSLLTDQNHSLLETSTSTDSSHNNQPLHSSSSSSSTPNTSQTILLFSQRTQF